MTTLAWHKDIGPITPTRYPHIYVWHLRGTGWGHVIADDVTGDAFKTGPWYPTKDEAFADLDSAYARYSGDDEAPVAPPGPPRVGDLVRYVKPPGDLTQHDVWEARRHRDGMVVEVRDGTGPVVEVWQFRDTRDDRDMRGMDTYRAGPGSLRVVARATHERITS